MASLPGTSPYGAAQSANVPSSDLASVLPAAAQAQHWSPSKSTAAQDFGGERGLTCLSGHPRGTATKARCDRGCRRRRAAVLLPCLTLQPLPKHAKQPSSSQSTASTAGLQWHGWHHRNGQSSFLGPFTLQQLPGAQGRPGGLQRQARSTPSLPAQRIWGQRGLRTCFEWLGKEETEQKHHVLVLGFCLGDFAWEGQTRPRSPRRSVARRRLQGRAPEVPALSQAGNSQGPKLLRWV